MRIFSIPNADLLCGSASGIKPNRIDIKLRGKTIEIFNIFSR